MAIRTARLCLRLPHNAANKVYTDQVIRSSASAAANYRAACRAKSTADFLYKLRVVEEELDETMFFYEMIVEFNPEEKGEIDELHAEANELLSIIVASIHTTVRNQVNLKKNEQPNIGRSPC